MVWRKVSNWCIESDSYRIEKYVSENTFKPRYRVIGYEGASQHQFGCVDDPQSARQACEDYDREMTALRRSG